MKFLLNRALFSLVGEDAERYLNGQITNDVTSLKEEGSLFAFITNSKGRVEGDCWVHKLSDGKYYIDVPLELREDLLLRLDRYLIADDAEFLDVTDLFHVLHSTEVLADQTHEFYSKTLRYGQLKGEWGHDYIISREATRVEVESDSALDSYRIQQGVPNWTNEYSKGLFPAETGLIDFAVSFNKGCYIGQEIISRMKMSGRINNEIQSFRANEAPSGSQIYNGDGKEVGEITSLFENTGLCLLKSRKIDAETRLVDSKGKALHIQPIN